MGTYVMTRHSMSWICAYLLSKTKSITFPAYYLCLLHQSLCFKMFAIYVTVKLVCEMTCGVADMLY